MAGVTRRDSSSAGRFRRLYGESPLHLLILLASFALCGYAAVRLLADRWLAVAIWFVACAVLHDLVLVPLYGVLDRLGRRPFAGRGGVHRDGVNYVRVPGFLSLLLLLVYWPLVLRNSAGYTPATGLSADVYLGRWLLVTAALFVLSALWFVGRGLFGGGPVERASHRPPDDLTDR
ncbi:hypothetical protein [Streptomyces sp. AcH 505]|uniref:hypothetical protein n=1 Tax=Streptomyces sp. AcH 505 TaxID=352211 RepID=UPI0005A98958